MYEPLPSETSIKLLKVDCGNDRDFVRCSVCIVDVTDAPPYIALSYVWGNLSQKLPLLCDSRILEVTQNLRDALCELYKRGLTSSLMWVDAICIDQDSVQERNQQVKLMANIFKRASHVVIWLGLDTHNVAQRAFEQIEKTTKLLVHHQNSRNTNNSADDIKSRVNVNRVSGVIPSVELSTALVDMASQCWINGPSNPLFNLPWFSRTWVIQEVGLAVTATAIWGSATIEWNLIGMLTMFLVRHCQLLLEQSVLSAAVHCAYNLYVTYSLLQPLASFLHLLDNVRPH